MRHLLLPSLQVHLHRFFLTTVMSSSFPLRGRGRRSFSNSPLISGDSHFQSVRQTNNNITNNDYRRVGFNYNNTPNPNTNTNNRNYNINNNNSNNNTATSNNYNSYNNNSNRRFNQPSGVRPPQQQQRSRPADFRVWEYSKNPPPPNAERFVVLSYNILADYLANTHRHLYFHIPRRFMSWDWRKGNILFELGLWAPDVMCLQEVDRFQELEKDLRLRGYNGIWKMRTGDRVDGCAIFWRASRFKLVYDECVEFNKLGMRDNVAQICVLESQFRNHGAKQLLNSADCPNRVVVCNIHVLYNPRRGEMKLGQVRVLLERAQEVSKKWDDAPVVVCGDFNCTPKSPLYNFISEQKLDISYIGRDKVSGQASAEIRSPPRQYGQTRGQSTGITSNPTKVMNQNVSVKKSLDTEYSQSNHPSHESLPYVSSKSDNDSISCTTSGDPVGSHTDKYTDNIRPSGTAEKLLSEVKAAERVPEHISTLASAEKQISGIAQDFGNSSDLHAIQLKHTSVVLSESVELHESNVTGDLSSRLCDTDPTPVSVGNHEASGPETVSLVESDIDEKLVELSVDDANETLQEDEDLGEDAECLVSELNKDAGDVILKDLSLNLEAEEVDMDKPLYDPSLWTPMEIATGTGDSGSMVVEHSLKLRSVYSEVESISGTRDSNGEPLVTSYNCCFMGTVDYIWRSEGLCMVKVLAPISKIVMESSRGFPTKKWGSDHIALASELAFKAKGEDVGV